MRRPRANLRFRIARSTHVLPATVGVTMGILLVICLCGVLLAGTFGIYDLQVRLERWDRERHAED